MLLIARAGQCLLLGTVCILAACAATSAAKKEQKPTPVEVWRGGDDGLTLRLTDAVEAVFRASPMFAMSSGKQRGTLVVTIPNLHWKMVGPRTQASYSIEFSGESSQHIGTSTGTCWEDELSKCAAQILKDAQSAKGSE